MREIGKMNVSIGTCIALESFLEQEGPDRKPYTPVDITQYSDLSINLRTLYRNIIGSSKEHMSNSMTLMILRDEIEEITIFIRNWGIPVKFYLTDVSTLSKLTSQPQSFRVPKTTKQIEDMKDENKVLSYFLQRVEVHEGRYRVTSKKPLVITHLSVDLLDPRVTLLETHTGKVKKSTEFHTKFQKLMGKDKKRISLETIPFSIYSLLIFGDRTMIKPLNIKLRRHIVELSKKNRWNATTEKGKFVSAILLDGNKELSEFLNTMGKVPRL